MSSAPLTVPPPAPNDHEDVAWALRAASAQWRRDAFMDAVAWVERAAETAEEVGQISRSIELIQLSEALKRGAQSGQSLRAQPPAAPSPPVAAAPPPPVAVAPPPPLPPPRAPQNSIEVDVDIDVDEVEFVEEVDEIDDLAPAAPALRRGDERTRMEDLRAFMDANAPASVPPPPPKAGVSLSDLRDMMPGGDAPAVEFDEVEMGDDLFDEDELGLLSAETAQATSEEIDDFPTDRPSEGELGSEPSGPTERDAFQPAPSSRQDFGELDFADEAPTSRHSLNAPERRITPPSYGDATAGLDLDLSSPAEVAMSRRSGHQVSDTEDIEQELGVSLSLDVSRPLPPPRVPSLPQRPPSAKPGPPSSHGVAGMASVRPSRPPGPSDRIAHTGPEPFGHAPSAMLPPVEPPSRPSQAPPALSMREPTPDLPSAPPKPSQDEPSGAIHSSPAPPVPARSAPAPLASVPPSHIEAPLPRESRPPSMRIIGTVVDGIDLLNVPGLQDLPEEGQARLLASATVKRLERGEEVLAFGVALVTHGAVQIMPTIADAACGVARKGEVIFTRGSLATGVDLRVVGFDPGSRVALFSREALEAATADCPWVADELALVADKYQALAGAVMGALGDSLDDMFRGMVLDKCVLKRAAPDSEIARAGKVMDGLYIVGAGSVLVLAADGSVAEELAPGDFLFAETLLGGGPAPKNARVGSKGALMLYATRMAAHELLATCPPFIELLAR